MQIDILNYEPAPLTEAKETGKCLGLRRIRDICAVCGSDEIETRQIGEAVWIHCNLCQSDYDPLYESQAPAIALIGSSREPSDYKSCPRCPSQGRTSVHPLSDFGICRARKDGLNLYCKKCIREKVHLHRIEVRAYREARAASQQGQQKLKRSTVKKLLLRRGHPRAVGFAAQMRKLAPHDRIVLSLTTFGEQMFVQLRHSCRLTNDELSDALARVIGEEVGSRNGTGPRVYFINDGTKPKTQFAPREPRSYGVSTIYGGGEK